VEEALVEMYLAGVSVRRVEDITEALWGSRVSPSTISDLNQKIFERVEKWRNRPLETEYPYVFVDGIWLKRSWGGEVQNVSVLVAIGVSTSGFREILGVCEGSREDSESWRQFLRYLRERGLARIGLLISDKSLGLLEALGEFYPEAKWQRCVVHFYRNVLHAVPHGKAKEVALMLKAIHAQEDKEAARHKTSEVIRKLQALCLEKAARILESGSEETLSYYAFPASHWRHIRTNNPLERLNREIRRRTRVVGSFPDGHAALMLVAARLRYMAGQKWGTERYMNMKQETAV
jgi:transposase-like protein